MDVKNGVVSEKENSEEEPREKGIVSSTQKSVKSTVEHKSYPQGWKIGERKLHPTVHCIILRFIDLWFGKLRFQLGDECEYTELAIKTVRRCIRTSNKEVSIAKMTKTFCVPGLLFLNGANKCYGLKPILLHTDADQDNMLKNY